MAAEKKKQEEKEAEENSIENPISQILALKHPEIVENAKIRSYDMEGHYSGEIGDLAYVGLEIE